MSDGKTHAAVSTGAAIGVGVIATITPFLQFPEALIVALGTLTGVFITPDLDHDMTIESHRYVNRWFGRIPRWWWYHLWHSYSLAFKHRTFWSHAPIVSTILRLTFLLFPPIIVIFHDQRTTRFFRLTYRILISIIMALPIMAVVIFLYAIGVDIIYPIYFLAGLVISDILHWLFDIL